MVNFAKYGQEELENQKLCEFETLSSINSIKTNLLTNFWYLHTIPLINILMGTCYQAPISAQNFLR